jgi:ssDNA-binding Zn-finger/Zn-ribbon topoisomerase 1
MSKRWKQKNRKKRAAMEAQAAEVTCIRKCPECHSSLTLRSGKFGLFWGCLGYPKCHYTQNYEGPQVKPVEPVVNTPSNVLDPDDPFPNTPWTFGTPQASKQPIPVKHKSPNNKRFNNKSTKHFNNWKSPPAPLPQSTPPDRVLKRSGTRAYAYNM